MSPALRSEVVQNDWSAGMSRDIAPALIPSNGAYDLVNALLDEDGNPYRRGGTEYKSSPSGTEEVLDNFNRANENPVSQGGNWIGPYGAEEADLALEGEQLGDPESVGTAVYNKSVADGFLVVTVAALGTEGLGISLAARVPAGEVGETAYLMEVSSPFVGFDWHVSLRRTTSGETVDLLTQKINPVVAGDKLGFKFVGSELSAWRKSNEEGAEWERLATTMKAPVKEAGLIAVLLERASIDDFALTPLTTFAPTRLTWLTDVYLKPGQRTVFADASDFVTLAADDESPVDLGGSGLALPKQSAVLDDLLFVGGSIYGGSRKEAVYSSGTATVATGSKVVTGTGTSWAANVDAGMLLHIGSERVYSVEAVNSDTELTLRDAYQGSGGGGKSYTLSPLYTLGSDPYQVADYMTVCANRLVLLIGRRILFTEVDNPHTFTNSFGTANEHTLPEGVEGVGLATVGETVLVFTTGGVWTLDGLALSIVDQNGNPQHRLQQFSSDLVLADAPGLAGSGTRLVVPTTEGVFLMDGISSPERISRSIDRLYRARIAAGYRLGKAEVYRGHYLLPILDGSANVRDLFVCRLDAPFRSRGATSFPWSRFTGDGGEVTAFAVRSSVDAREPLLLGAQAREPSHVLNCTPYFEPDAAHRVDADGSTFDFEMISRDIATGNNTENTIRSVEFVYDLVVDPAASAVVHAEWSDGSYVGGEAEWDAVSWDEFEWAAEEEGVVFNLIPQEGLPGNPGRKRFRVNKRQRYGRFRISTRGAPAFFALRQMKMNVRPSKAVRR